MKTRINKIIQGWFLSEPALFQIIVSHEIVENLSIKCPVRSGRGRVEYNPKLLCGMADSELDEALKTEAIRILLKHPYERRPDMCTPQAMAIGSNLTVGDNYHFMTFKLETPSDFNLETGHSYEWYSRKVQEMMPPPSQEENSDLPQAGASGQENQSNDSAGKNTPDDLTANSERNCDLSELWDEDELRCAMIDQFIEGCTQWGTLSGNFIEMLKASTKSKIDWHKVFAGFRTSVLSSNRHLTRMRPNRRSGFKAMGSTRKFVTRILVAVDVSGSVSSESLSYFYGAINSAFKYGIESIDVVQFDCGMAKVESLRKMMKNVTVCGRGGTSFQEPVDYACGHDYDGLVILTDGYAPPPAIPEHSQCKIMWVCDCLQSYEVNHEWMEKIGRVCMMDLI